MNNSLILSMAALGGNYINIISIVVIVLLTSFFLWLYDLRLLGSIGKSIRKLNIILNQMDSYEDEKAGLVDEDFMKVLHPAVVRLWHGYTTDDAKGSQMDGLSEAGRYFTISRVVNIPACRKQAEAAPALLTLIGTALSLAVMMAHLLIGGAESRNLAEIILSSLIPAVASALLAIIYTLMDRIMYQQTISELDRMIVALENNAPHIRVAADNGQVIAANGSNNLLHDLSQDIRSMVSLMDGREMSASLTTAIEASLKNNLLPPVENLHETVLQFSQIALANEAELMDRMASSFINRLGDLTGNIFSRLSDSLVKLYKLQEENAGRLEQLASELAGGVEEQRKINLISVDIIRSITEKHSEMLEFNLKLAESLDKAGPMVLSLAEAAEANSRTMESMSEKYGQLHENLDGRLEELFIKLNDTSSVLLGNMEDSLKEFLETLSQKTGELMEHLQTQSESVGSGARDIAGELDELNFRLENSVREFNEQMHKGIGQTFGDFDKNLSDICGRFSKTITEMRDTVEDIHAVLGIVKKNIACIRENEK